MKILFIVCLSIWFFSSTLFSAPLDVRPAPPVADPVLPTEKDPFFVNSSTGVTHSPGNLLTLQHLSSFAFELK